MWKKSPVSGWAILFGSSTVLTLISAVAPASAQCATNSYEHPPVSVIFPALPPMQGDPFGQVLCSEVTGDGITDVVCLRGARAQLIFGPNVYHGLNEALIVELLDDAGMAENVVDLALQPAVGPDLTSDVFSVGTGGLVRWRWDSGAGDFARETIAAWPQVKRVSTWQYPGSIFAHVAVAEQTFQPDGEELWFLHTFLFLKSSGNFFASYPAVDLGSSPVHDLLLYGHDAGPEPAVAVVREVQLELYDVYGGPRGGPFASFGEPGLLTAVGEVGSIQERLAFVIESFLGPMLVLIEQGVTTGALLLGGDVPRFGSGDADGDGDADLCVSRTPGDPLTVFFNQTTFQAGASVPVLQGGAAPGDLPGVPVDSFAFGDLEGDGDADVLVLDDDSSRGMLYRGECRDATGLSPDVDPCGILIVQPSPPGANSFGLSVPVSVTAEAALDFTHLEVIAWPRLDVFTPLTASFDFHDEFELPALDAGEVWDTTVPVDGLPLPGNTTSWILELRLTRIVAGEARRTAPPTAVAFNATGSGGPPDACQQVGAGVGTVRGDFIPLDFIPPMGGVPMGL